MTTFAYSSGDPGNLVGGSPASMSDISGPFDDLETFLNGNIDTTNLATSAKPSSLLAPYKMVHEAVAMVNSGDTAGTKVFYIGSNTELVASGLADSGGKVAFSLNPDDYTVSGLSAKMRVRFLLMTNSVAPAMTFTTSLYPMVPAGASSSFSLTVGTVVSSSSAQIVSPAASSAVIAVSSDFSVPSAGCYGLGVLLSNTPAAGFVGVVQAQVQVHHTT